jgi:hypothetical protein
VHQLNCLDIPWQKSINTVHYVMTALNKFQFCVIRKSYCKFKKIHTFTKTFLHFYDKIIFPSVSCSHENILANSEKWQTGICCTVPDQILRGIGSKNGFQQVPIRSVSGPQHFRSINIAKIRQQRAQACNLKKVISLLRVLCIH